jgi:hypothetical protein
MRLYFIDSKNEDNIGKIFEDNFLISRGNNEAFVYLDKDFGKMMDRFAYNVDFLQKWAFTKFGDKSFVEELVYGDFSLWYQLEFLFLCDVDWQMGYELSIPGITWYIDAVNKFLDKYEPLEVFIENKNTQINKIILKLCEQRNIKVDMLGIYNDKPTFFSWLVHNRITIDCFTSARILFRRLIGKFFSKKFDRSDLLILTNDRLSNKYNENDFFWGPIIKELNLRSIKHKVIEYDRIEAFQSFGNIKRRYVTQLFDAQFIGTYYDKDVIKQTRRMRSFLINKYREFCSRKSFRDSFNYKGIYFYDIFKPRLRKVLTGFSRLVADSYIIGKSIIEKESPKLVVVDHEKNYYGRALINYARLRNIPSLCSEGELNNSYLTHVPVDGINNGILFRPLPDIKLLWGEDSKVWNSTRNFIDESRLRVIGCPKYDFLGSMDESTTKKIRERYNVKNRLITIITVLLPDEVGYIKSVLSSVEEGDKVIIKMHPADPVGNASKLRGILKDSGVDGVVITGGNSSELIFASDLVVTYSSTLVYECILLDKPTILFGYGVDQPYIRDGLIKLNTTFPEISSAIKNYKKMDPILRDKFIKKYLYSDDWKSSVRAVDEIERLMGD